MKKNNYLLKNTLTFTIGSISTKLISFFLVPFYTYLLTTDEYGTIDVLFTVSSLITPFIMCNIGEAVMRFSLDKDSDYNKILSISLGVSSIGFILGTIAIVIERVFFDNEIYYSLMIIYIMVSSLATVYISYLRGREMLKAYVGCNILNTLLIAILNIYFLAFCKLGINGYFLAYIVANLIVAIIAFSIGKQYRGLKNFRWDNNLFKQMCKYSLGLVPNSLIWWITNSSDRIMVSYFLGNSSTGLYAVSYKIPSVLTMASSIFSNAWLFSAIKEKDEKDPNEYSRLIFDKLLCITAFLAGLILLSSKIIFKILISSEFYEAWKFTPFLIYGFVFQTLGTFFGTYYYVEKDTLGNVLTASGGAILNIVLNLILIPVIGINGAAIATAASYFCVFICRIINTRKYIQIKTCRIDYIVILCLLLCMTITLYVEKWYSNVILIVEYLFMVLVRKDFIEEISDSLYRLKEYFLDIISTKFK